MDVRSAEVERLGDDAVDEHDGRRLVLQIQHARLILGFLGIGDDFLDQGRGILMDADDRRLDGLGCR